MHGVAEAASQCASTIVLAVCPEGAPVNIHDKDFDMAMRANINALSIAGVQVVKLAGYFEELRIASGARPGAWHFEKNDAGTDMYRELMLWVEEQHRVAIDAAWLVTAMKTGAIKESGVLMHGRETPIEQLAGHYLRECPGDAEKALHGRSRPWLDAQL